MAKENVHRGHRQRLKQRFLENGLNGFAEHEIMELLLYYAIPVRDVNEIAHNLINHFGSLQKVLNADYETLKDMDGLGEHSAVLLKLMPALFERYITPEDSEKTALVSGKLACEYFERKFLGETREKVKVLCVDDDLYPINCKTISEGSPDEVLLTKRKIVEFTFQNKSSRIMLAHNHPNGMAIASYEDIVFTKNISRSLREIGIELLDHIIVGNDRAVSMSATGAYSYDDEEMF